MYEEMTFAAILDRMLRKAEKDSPGIDTRQSSPVYTAIAPAAFELQNAYIELRHCLEQFFVKEQNRENLVKNGKPYGIEPYPATYAVVRGEFNVDVPIGTRFSCGTVVFSVSDKMDDGVYRLTCETPGTAGNITGQLIPIEYIMGLTHAEIKAMIETGSEEEETEHFRARYMNAIQKPSTSGNKYDYQNWAMECQGVGAAKVFPLASGPGTVTVIIADTDMSAASTDLVQKVKEHIEGLRPIGAGVTVASVVERPVNVSADIKLKLGMNLGTVQNAFRAALTDYLRREALDMSYVSMARAGNLLLGTDGVEDYSGLVLNGGTENVELNEDEIAVTGTITLGVM